MITILRVLFYMIAINSTVLRINPFRLEDIALANVRNGIQDNNVVKIIEKIYPEIFSTEKSLTKSGFMSFIFKKSIKLSTIDLSNLDIERIPESIVDSISGLEILNLSGNANIELKEEWFYKLIKNNKIRELSLSNCALNESDFEVIDKIETLETLNISRNKNMNIQTDSFVRILKRLKHLNISACQLGSICLQFIFEKAENLNSLDYSQNTVIIPVRYLSNATASLRKSLESLNLSYCSLNTSDLEYIFIFERLREIDLSGNSFLMIDSALIKRLFIDKVSNRFDSVSDGFFDFGYYQVMRKLFNRNDSNTAVKKDIYLDSLKSINLKNCKINSSEFIEKFFNLEGLESLDISKNSVGLDFRNSQEYKCKHALRTLKMNKGIDLTEASFSRLLEFKHLEYLDISDNFFESLSANFTLGELANSLIHLNASYCKWNMNGLKAIAECKKLRYLNASFNNFRNASQDLDFKELKNTLKEVSLSVCGLNLNFIEKLSECKKIEKLFISGNIIGNLPEKFSLKNLTYTLKHLEIMYCGWNLNGLKAITECFNLSYLSAWKNRFTNIESDFDLGNLKYSLKEVNIGFSHLNSYGLIAFTKCQKLKNLNVSHSQFSNLPQNFNFDLLRNSLEKLTIDNCELKSLHLKAITDCMRLKYLDAKYNDFSCLPQDFTLGISRDSLECIFLNSCRLNHNILKAITDCRKLEKLFIGHNNFENITKNTKLGCSKESLIELWINSSRLNHIGLSLITDCSKLQNLFANNNNFSQIPEGFKFGRSKYSLKELDLSWCKLNSNGMRAVLKCSKLVNLTAKYSIIRSFHYHLRIGPLKDSLRFVDLSDSELIDRVLDVFDDCTAIEQIDLTDCKITHYSDLEYTFEKLKRGKSLP